MDRLLTRSVAQTLGVSFANSALSSPRSGGRDPLRDGAALVTWLNRSGVGPGSEVMQQWLAAAPGELDAVADRARSLRKWFREFLCGNLGRSLTTADLERLGRLNSLVKEERRFYRIVEAAEGRQPLTLEFSTPWESPHSALVRIGEILALFVCEVDFARIKICQGASCSSIFVDRSRGSSRRWCSMAICGNRSKQASLRGRAKFR
jgi:predicted RNA-binding Zn ribbon-like protein